MDYLLRATHFDLNLADYPFKISTNSSLVRIKGSIAPSLSLSGSKPTTIDITKAIKVTFSLSSANFTKPGRNIRKQLLNLFYFP